MKITTTVDWVMKKRIFAVMAAVYLIMAGSAHAELIDNKNGTFYETVQGLVWMQKADCFEYQSWGQAKSNVSVLKSGLCGLRDGSKSGQWRLPAKDDLKWRGARRQGFSAPDGYYWTSTESSFNNAVIYSVYIGKWIASDVMPTAARIWAVRSPVASDLPR